MPRSSNAAGWTLLITQLPPAPSRHRVAVWRELRKLGAVPLGHGTWALPDVPALASSLSRVRALVDRAKGSRLVELTGAGRTKHDEAHLRRLFVEARDAEWTEFLADCGKFDAELRRETETQKFTLAELDEEEQSLDRLRVWFRDIRRRSVIAGTLEQRAAARLHEVSGAFDRYAERVYETVHAATPATTPRRKR